MKTLSAPFVTGDDKQATNEVGDGAGGESPSTKLIVGTVTLMRFPTVGPVRTQSGVPRNHVVGRFLTR